MSADNVKELRDSILACASCIAGNRFTAFDGATLSIEIDELIAAVREDEREQAIKRVLVPSNRYTFCGNKMSGYDEGEYLRTKQTVEAIRNA